MSSAPEHHVQRIRNIMSRSPYAPPLPYGGWVLSLTILLGGFVWAKREDAAAISRGNISNNTSSNTGGEGDSSTSSSAWWDWGAEANEDYEEEEEEEKEEKEGEEDLGGHGDRGFRTPSTAYQTDQEARSAQVAARRQRRRQQNGRSATRKDSAIYSVVTKRASTSPPQSLPPPPPLPTATMAVGGSNPPNDKPAAVCPGSIDKATRAFDAAAAAAAAAGADAAAARVAGRVSPGRLSRADRWRLEREAFRIRVHDYVRRELGKSRKGSPVDREAAAASAVETTGPMRLVLQ